MVSEGCTRKGNHKNETYVSFRHAQFLCQFVVGDAIAMHLPNQPASPFLRQHITS